MSNGLVTTGVVAAFVVWVLFVAVNISVAYEVAQDRGRSAGMWACFAFLFPVVGPFLVWLLPRRPRNVGTRA